MNAVPSQKFAHVAWEGFECRAFLNMYGYETQIVL